MKKIIKKIFLPIFFLGIVYFFWNTLFLNLENIKNYDFQFHFFYIFSSLFFLVLVVLYWWVLWKKIVKWLEVPYVKVFYIQSISWLAKYLPGKAGIILAKIFFLSQHGIDKKRWLVSSIYENIFQVVASFLVSIPILLYFFSGELSNYYLFFSLFFIVGFLVFIYPPVFYFCINFWLKIFKKEILSKEFFLTEKEIVKNLFLYSLGLTLNGFAFFLMIKGITDISWSLLFPIIWVWNFAGVIWLLAIFVPAGLWVREWILLLFLGIYFPFEIATLIAVFSRFWTTLGDGFIGLFVLFFKYFRNGKK